MMLHGQSVAYILEILMAADTPEGIAASVEDKTLLWIDYKLAAAKAGRNHITAGERCCCGIEIRILQTVPEMYMFNYKLRSCMTVHRGNGFRLTVYADGHLRSILPSLHRNAGRFAA